jgi:hypothetical protein
VSPRDTFLQLGFVLIATGAVILTWALLSGPLARRVRRGDDPTPEPADDPRNGSSEAQT